MLFVFNLVASTYITFSTFLIFSSEGETLVIMTGSGLGLTVPLIYMFV